MSGIGKILFCALSCLIVIWSWTAAAHAECGPLKEIASLPLVPMKDDTRVMVPATLDGHRALMLVDSGAPASSVEADSALRMQLIVRRMHENMMFNSLGQPIDQVALVHDFVLGHAHASGLRMVVTPTRMGYDMREDGSIAADLLRNYDVEFDFAAGKMNLFSPDHCPGKVIYWKASAVAVVPIHEVHSGHLVLNVALDGQPLNAVLDTGASVSVLYAQVARNRFGLTLGSSDTPSADREGDYTHRFKTLDFGGIAVGNPEIMIIPDLAKQSIDRHAFTGSRLAEHNEENGETAMIIGMRELSQLHLYIAYHEGKMYVTPPSGPSAPPPPSQQLPPPTSGPSSPR